MWVELNTLLTERELTQRDLARATDLDESLISQWVRGRQKPNAKHLVVLADYFNVPIDHLLGVGGHT